MNDAQFKARKLLKKNQKYLSPQQIKTLNGLIKAGNIEGAMNGMHTILARVITAGKERTDGAYWKAKKGNRSEAVREPLRPAMHS